ncbi:MAG: hypothetical protein ACK4N5_11845, partial [Myxococcales bacterium]
MRRVLAAISLMGVLACGEDTPPPVVGTASVQGDVGGQALSPADSMFLAWPQLGFMIVEVLDFAGACDLANVGFEKAHAVTLHLELQALSGTASEERIAGRLEPRTFAVGDADRDGSPPKKEAQKPAWWTTP